MELKENFPLFPDFFTALPVRSKEPWKNKKGFSELFSPEKPVINCFDFNSKYMTALTFRLIWKPPRGERR
jgi:hypothetical protein